MQPSGPEKQNSQRGFSLLEAVVAIVLISSAGLALFSWMNSNLVSLQRVKEVNARTEATQNALEYMAAVNPMLTPRGKENLGDMQLAWDAQLAGAIKDGTNYPMGIGLWQFALYDTNVTLTQEGRQPWFSFRLKQIGYKRVRTVQLD